MEEITNCLDLLALFDTTLASVSVTAMGLADDFMWLDSYFQRLSSYLGKQNSGIAVVSSQNGLNQAAGVNALPAYQARQNGESPTLDDILKGGMGISKSVESGLKAISAFKELSPVLDTVKKSAGGLKGAFEALSGVESFAEATGVTGRLVASGEIMEGLAAVAEGAAAFGPVGLAVAGGVLLAGGLAVYVAHELDTPNNRPASFGEEAIKKGNTYLAQINNTEATANDYIGKAEAPREKSALEITKDVERLKNSFLKKGGVIDFDWSLAEGRDPVYIRALTEAMAENDVSKKKTIKGISFGVVDDMNYFKSHFDKFGHYNLTVKAPTIDEGSLRFPNVGDGPAQVVKYRVEISQKEIERRKKKGPTISPLQFFHDGLLNTAVQQYLTDPNRAYKYLKKEYNDELKLYKGDAGFQQAAAQLWGRFQKVKKVIDHSRALGSGRQRASHSPQGIRQSAVSRIVNINLNKPMIENFTINVSNAQEGVKDFKRKVEEVLLEILNSANVAL